MRCTRRISLLGSIAFALLPSTATAIGVGYTVNSLADAVDATPGDLSCATAARTCTLRAAIMEANHTPAIFGVAIDLPAGTYVLSRTAVGDDETTGDLDILRSMTITGSGNVEISASGLSDRVLHVQGGVVTLSGMRITHGSALYGAGILVESGVTSLAVHHCAVVGTDTGAGIYVKGGSVAVTRSTIAQNLAESGGGIQVVGGSLELTDSTLWGNRALGGGAIFVGGGTATITRSTIEGNHAAVMGGGVAVGLGGAATLIDTTISGNVAENYGGGVSVHASAAHDGTRAAFYNCTITENEVVPPIGFDTGYGGGISEDLGATVTLTNTIVAGNVRVGVMSTTASDCHGTMHATNAIIHAMPGGPNGCTATGPYSTAWPALGPLRENGGLTRTHALPPSSPAVNAGTSTGCLRPGGVLLETDQRGVNRHIGTCDLGAFELEPLGDVNGNGQRNVSDILYLINYLFAAGPQPVGRGDTNGDGLQNVADVLFLINYLFAGGPEPGV